MKSFKRITLSLQSLAHLISVSGIKAGKDIGDISSMMDGLRHGDTKVLPELEKEIYSMLSYLEKIKSLAAQLGFKELYSLSSIIRASARHNVFNISTSERARRQLREIYSLVDSGLNDQVRYEKGLRKGKPPRRSFWKRLSHSDKGLAVQEVREGHELIELEKEKYSLYNEIKDSVDYLAKHEADENKKLEIAYLLVEFEKKIEEEFEDIFNIETDVEIQESHLKKRIDELESMRFGDDETTRKVRKIFSDLEKDYGVYIKEDISYIRKIRKRSKHILRRFKRI